MLPSVEWLRHAELYDDSVTLEWEPPSRLDTTRHRLRSYVVERYVPEPPPPRWERLAAVPSTITRYTVSGLGSGQRYRFRVYGETDEGLSGRPFEYEPPPYTPQIGGILPLKRISSDRRFSPFSTLLVSTDRK